MSQTKGFSLLPNALLDLLSLTLIVMGKGQKITQALINTHGFISILCLLALCHKSLKIFPCEKKKKIPSFHLKQGNNSYPKVLWYKVYVNKRNYKWSHLFNSGHDCSLEDYVDE